MTGGPTFTFAEQADPPATRAPSRADRIRATAQDRYRSARGQSERFAAAVDYIRAAAAEAARSGVDPAPSVAEATRAVLAAGDAITDELARQGRAW